MADAVTREPVRHAARDGHGPDPEREPVRPTLPLGLRTVDGTCNNLITRPGESAPPTASSRGTPAFPQAESAPRRPGAYTQKVGIVVDDSSRGRSAT